MPKDVNVRTKILNTAGLLFMTKGYELIGINEIIEKSQVAKATFYNHFKSKERLCLEWLREEKAKADLSNQEILTNYESAEDRIMRKYALLEQHLIRYQFRGCPFSNTMVMAPDSVELAHFISAYKQSALLFWQTIVKDGRGKESLGETLFLLYSGATTEAQNARSTSFIKAAQQMSCSFFLIKFPFKGISIQTCLSYPCKQEFT